MKKPKEKNIWLNIFKMSAGSATREDSETKEKSLVPYISFYSPHVQDGAEVHFVLSPARARGLAAGLQEAAAEVKLAQKKGGGNGCL